MPDSARMSRRAMRRSGARVAVACALLAGCASLEPQVPTIVDAAHAGPVHLYQGETLVVALATPATDRGHWQQTAGDGAVLAQVGTSDLLPPQVAQGTVGAPNDTVYRFHAAAPGSTTLVLAYRGADGATMPAQEMRVDVSVAERPGAIAGAWRSAVAR
jgi:predicted secreted protein